MLDSVTRGFRAAKHKLTGKAELNEANIDDALRDIRVALLEADVEFNVAKRFLARVKEKALGEVVTTSATDKKGRRVQVSPGDQFIKICHDELENLMGPVDTSLQLARKGERPAGVMLVGLQGSGKTTTVAKLANLLVKQGHKPLMVAADIYRPAAVEQLKQLGAKLDIPVFHEENVKPPDMAQHALSFAGQKNRDVILYDTAGRLAIDEEMMSELEHIQKRVEPENVLLVADAMIGQDAVKTAGEFDRRLQLSGFILTKLDGDARGGAALSIKEVTGKPIKFVLHDFVEQIKLVKKMGSVNDLLEKFPLFGELPEGITFDDKELVRVEAMIGSMTKTERKNPQIIGDERIERIAKGAGQSKQHVRGLLDRFFAMQKVMRQIGGGPGGPGMGLLSRLPGFRQLAQLKQLKGMEPEELASLFGLPKEMTQAMPPVGGKGSHSAALARQRLMGFNQNPPRQLSDEERKRLREKRKQERKNKKNNRRR